MMVSIGSCLALGILYLTGTVNSLPTSANTTNAPLSLQCPRWQPTLTGLQVTRSLDAWPHEEDVICFKQSFFKGGLAPTQDCRLAMGSLPGEHLPGNFHSGGSLDDPFSLPKFLVHDKCNITMNIPAALEDDTTWPCVGQRIDILINACKVGTDQDGHVGGQTWAGSNKEILVTIVKSGKPVPQTLLSLGGLSDSSSIDDGTDLARRSGPGFAKANAGIK